MLRIAGFRERYYATQMWNQTNAVKDGTIRRETRFADNASEWIYSGPHSYVGNPYFQTPNPACKTRADYSRLDLTTLPANYRPRTNYVPDCEDYQERIPATPWGNKVTDRYRIALRKRFAARNERSLIATLLPPEVGHIFTIITVDLLEAHELIQVMQGLNTIVLGFLAKISGKEDMMEDLWGRFPVVPLDPSAAVRILGLNCLTQDYAGLWNDRSVPKQGMGWSRQDHRLDPEWFAKAY